MAQFRDKVRGYFSSWRLSTRLTAIMMLFIVVPMFFICELMFASMRKSVMRRQQNTTQQMMTSNYTQLETSIAACRQTGKAVTEIVRLEGQTASLLQAEGSFRPETLAAVNAVVADYPDIVGVRIFINDALIQPSPPMLYSMEEVKTQPWYSQPIPERNNSKIYVMYPSAQMEYLSAYAGDSGYGVLLSPVYVDDRLYGVVELSFSIYSLFRNMQSLPPNMWMCFADSNSILHYDKESISPEWRNMMGSVVYGAAEAPYPAPVGVLSINAHTVLVSSRTVEALSGKLILAMRMDQDLIQLRQLKLFFYVALLLFFVVCAVLTNGAVKHVLKRFGKLTKIAQEVSRGNLGVSVPDMGNDEIGEFANALNGTLSGIRELLDKSVSRELLVKNAELRALQSQINSHFIYNVLESIKMMAEIEERYEISDAVTSLGELLRYSMRWSGSMVELQEELHYIKDYVSLQNLRYDFFVQLKIEIPEQYMSHKIPKMSLQPIVENAMIHGIEQMEKDGVITICLKEYADFLEIEITDSGKGIPAEKLRLLERKVTGKLLADKKRGGIGLKNVEERIQLCFGPKYGLRFYSEPGRFTKVVVKLPIGEEAEDEACSDC